MYVYDSTTSLKKLISSSSMDIVVITQRNSLGQKKEEALNSSGPISLAVD